MFRYFLAHRRIAGISGPNTPIKIHEQNPTIFFWLIWSGKLPCSNCLGHSDIDIHAHTYLPLRSRTQNLVVRCAYSSGNSSEIDELTTGKIWKWNMCCTFPQQCRGIELYPPNGYAKCILTCKVPVDTHVTKDILITKNALNGDTKYIPKQLICAHI